MRIGIAAQASLAVLVLASAGYADEGDKTVPTALSFTMQTIDGKNVKLASFKGKVVMFVNVASQCGLTPQYKDLQTMYDKYKDKGLVIVGVPANEFGKQEPGTNEQIAEFCSSKFGVTFPMMAKVVVKGNGICPLYKYLTAQNTEPAKAGPISWNFEKFIVSREGKVVARFSPRTKPTNSDLIQILEAELAK